MIRDILLATATYPEPTRASSVEVAVAVADHLGAQISALAFEVEIPSSANFMADGFLDIDGMIESERQKSSTAAQRILGAFEHAATARGVFGENLLRRCLTSAAPTLLTNEARLHDLTIVPVSEVDGVEQWYAEAVVFGSGRPMLVLPSVPSAPALDVVVIAWDGSRPAARAVADALPLLGSARTVHIVTVTREKPLEEPSSGAGLVRNLARHGVQAHLEEVDIGGRTIGEALQTYVADKSAGLLVMGAYGHSRIRDFILGGATRSLLGHAPVPLFMSH